MNEDVKEKKDEKGIYDKLDASLLDVFYREYEYRHNLLWSIVKIYLLACVTLYVYPLINIKALLGLKYKVLIFPVLSFILSMIGIWHIKCESLRFKVVSDKYNEVRGKENRPGWVYNGKFTFIQYLLSENVNELLVLFYSISSFFLATFSGTILFDYMQNILTRENENSITAIVYIKIAIISTVILLLTLIYFFIKSKNSNRNKEINERVKYINRLNKNGYVIKILKNYKNKEYIINIVDEETKKYFVLKNIEFEKMILSNSYKYLDGIKYLKDNYELSDVIKSLKKLYSEYDFLNNERRDKLEYRNISIIHKNVIIGNIFINVNEAKRQKAILVNQIILNIDKYKESEKNEILVVI